MKKLLILAIFMVLPTLATAVDYQFSMLPRYFPEHLTKMMSPLAEHLATQTGEKIEAILTDDFSDYEKQVNNGKIAIGYQNPLVYVNVAKNHEVLAMAIKDKDGDKFRGIIITRPDSDIKSLADLKGKLIMIVGETSAGGYLSQKLSLSDAGIDISDMTIDVAADNRQENVIISVSVGDVDAGFIRESAFHVADKYIMPNSIKTIAETAWLPNWALSINRNMDTSLKQKVSQAVLGLQENDPVLQALGLRGFRKADDSEYDVMRKLAAE
jgi:phosphonate transport system substrate-binding protein